MTPTVTNKLILRVTGLASQFSALSASLWSGATQISTFSSNSVNGNRLVVISDSANGAFSLSAGQAYTLKVTGISSGIAQHRNWYCGCYQRNSAVPEPESFALLLAGLGLVGVAAKRGRQKSAQAPLLSCLVQAFLLGVSERM